MLKNIWEYYTKKNVIKNIWGLYTNKNKYVNMKNMIIISIDIILLLIFISIIFIIFVNNIPKKDLPIDTFTKFSLNYDNNLKISESNQINPYELNRPIKFGKYSINFLLVNIEYKNNNKINCVIKFEYNNTEDILSFIIDINDNSITPDNKLLGKTKKFENYLLLNSIEIDNDLKWRNINITLYTKSIDKIPVIINSQEEKPIVTNLENPINDNTYVNPNKNKTPEIKEDTLGIVPIDVKDDSQKETDTIRKQIKKNNNNISNKSTKSYLGKEKNITVGNMRENFFRS